MNIRIGREYKTGLAASTDLHAGGIFFCIIYEQVIKFTDASSVEMYYKVINPLSPMDDYDVEQLSNYFQKGSWSYNNQGYLYCQFPDISYELTGRTTGDDEKIIAFQSYNKNSKVSSSVVYTLTEAMP